MAESHSALCQRSCVDNLVLGLGSVLAQPYRSPRSETFGWRLGLGLER